MLPLEVIQNENSNPHFFFSIGGIGGKEVITGDPEFVPCLQQRIEKKILRKVGKLLEILKDDSTNDSTIFSALF